ILASHADRLAAKPPASRARKLSTTPTAIPATMPVMIFVESFMVVLLAYWLSMAAKQHSPPTFVIFPHPARPLPADAALPRQPGPETPVCRPPGRYGHPAS